MKISKQKLEIAKARNCMTTETLSKKAKVSVLAITRVGNSNYETQPATVGKLAKALGVDVTDLLED
ncbi:MAG TPA: helix-turn-helix transcriptional regulator [Fusobacterium sp.]|uniref:helix-turn-helix transcriptional regulator n=1 Tax=Fusobacterium sp. TaxID=68766 RepID=UPI002F3F0ABF